MARTRALAAAEKAIANPLLDEISLKGARGVLINITGGYDLTLFELDEAANRIREEVDADANIIVGSTLDETMEGRMRVSVVATGIDVTATRPPTGQGRLRRRRDEGPRADDRNAGGGRRSRRSRPARRNRSKPPRPRSRRCSRASPPRTSPTTCWRPRPGRMRCRRRPTVPPPRRRNRRPPPRSR
jgi:cell division protein FtsZ